jgi:hypothetical protein
MVWQYNARAIPLVVAAAISLTLAFFAVRHPRATGATAFLVLMLALAWWSLGNALELSSVGLSPRRFWLAFQYVGIVVVPSAWLAVTLHYTGRNDWLTRRNLGLLAIEPALALLLNWTNEHHALFYTSLRLIGVGDATHFRLTYGLAFWLHTAYSYGLLLAGALLLVQALRRAPSFYRGQSLAALIGAALSWTANILHLAQVNPFSDVDLTSYAFTFAGLAVGWGIFRFRLLEILLAR